jgi:anti-sigma B factor antagonist
MDLRGLVELDSPTLAALIRVMRLVREVGGSVALVVNQPNFLRILSITGLDRVFPVWPDEDAAVASLGLPDVVPA